MKLGLAWVWFFLVVTGSAAGIDREAFTIARYQLNVQVDRTAHVFAATGKLTLRNDSRKPQKVLALQVSSSLSWNVIAQEGRSLQWLGDTYTSDIDHTGSLSEAIVTLPKEMAPGTTLTLEVQYGGTITADATRFIRIGAPADIAARNDWDEVSEEFTAVRGLGYVTWYPVALEAASLSDGNTLFDAIARWKQRHARSTFDVTFAVDAGDGKQPLRMAFNIPDSDQGKLVPADGPPNTTSLLMAGTHLAGMNDIVPAFAIANYVELSRPTISVLHTPQHTARARDYTLAAEANDPLLHEWFADSTKSATIVELTNPNASPYQNGTVLFTPFRDLPTGTLQLLLIPVQVAARFQSSHQWIAYGAQRFLQTLSVERRSGRTAALQYLDEFRRPLVDAEGLADDSTQNGPGRSQKLNSESDNTLLNTNDEVYLRAKSGFVFWMLRDMLGSEAMQRTLASYRSSPDNGPAYLQHLLQANSKRDLEWFFDDWVYRDRGLPEFRVESAYVRPLLGPGNNFLVTASVENTGHAGAEVPVMIQTPSGEKAVRVIIKAGEKGVGRLEVSVMPDKVIVNDGSVPEINTANNSYQLPKAGKP